MTALLTGPRDGGYYDDRRYFDDRYRDRYWDSENGRNRDYGRDRDYRSNSSNSSHLFLGDSVSLPLSQSSTGQLAYFHYAIIAGAEIGVDGRSVTGRLSCSATWAGPATAGGQTRSGRGCTLL